MKLWEAEDEEREQWEARAGKKRQRKRRKGRPEDLAFTDAGGSVHILTVGAGVRPGQDLGRWGDEAEPEPI